jgi:hypothetical protein
MQSYSCHQNVGSLKGKEFRDKWSSHNGVRKNSSAWRLVVGCVFRLFDIETQTNSRYQLYSVSNAYNRCVLFHMMREGNHDLCGDVTELHVLCGR